MKKIILSLLVLFSFSLLSAQIADDDFNDIFPQIKAENWKKAYKVSSKLLDDVSENDTSDNAGFARFLTLYSAAGMVKEGNMTYEELQVITNQFTGKNFISAYYIASMNPQNTLNKTLFTNFDGLNKGFTIVTTIKGKIVFYIEYDIVKDIEPKTLHGTMVSCGGMINEIELNPDKKTDWILKIKVHKAYLQ